MSFSPLDHLITGEDWTSVITSYRTSLNKCKYTVSLYLANVLTQDRNHLHLNGNKNIY